MSLYAIHDFTDRTSCLRHNLVLSKLIPTGHEFEFEKLAVFFPTCVDSTCKRPSVSAASISNTFSHDIGATPSHRSTTTSLALVVSVFTRVTCAVPPSLMMSSCGNMPVEDQNVVSPL